jgi:hypothetical protein
MIACILSCLALSCIALWLLKMKLEHWAIGEIRRYIRLNPGRTSLIPYFALSILVLSDFAIKAAGFAYFTEQTGTTDFFPKLTRSDCPDNAQGGVSLKSALFLYDIFRNQLLEYVGTSALSLFKSTIFAPPILFTATFPASYFYLYMLTFRFKFWMARSSGSNSPIIIQNGIESEITH